MKIVLNLKKMFGFKKSYKNFNYGFSYHWATQSIYLCTENSGPLVTWDVSILSSSLLFMFSLHALFFIRIDIFQPSLKPILNF